MTIVTDNQFVQLHRDFSTTYKSGKFVTTSDFYIPPVTVKLPHTGDGQVSTFQMVPLTELVPAVVQQTGYGEKLNKERRFLPCIFISFLFT